MPMSTALLCPLRMHALPSPSHPLLCRVLGSGAPAPAPASPRASLWRVEHHAVRLALLAHAGHDRHHADVLGALVDPLRQAWVRGQGRAHAGWREGGRGGGQAAAWPPSPRNTNHRPRAHTRTLRAAAAVAAAAGQHRRQQQAPAPPRTSAKYVFSTAPTIMWGDLQVETWGMISGAHVSTNPTQPCARHGSRRRGPSRGQAGGRGAPGKRSEAAGCRERLAMRGMARRGRHARSRGSRM